MLCYGESQRYIVVVIGQVITQTHTVLPLHGESGYVGKGQVDEILRVSWLVVSLSCRNSMRSQILSHSNSSVLYCTPPLKRVCKPLPSVPSRSHYGFCTCPIIVPTRQPGFPKRKPCRCHTILQSSRSGVRSPGHCLTLWQGMLLAGQPYFKEGY